MWRIPLVSILLLLSLLVLFKAPTNFFWRVAVAVTEFPYVFIAVSLISFFFCLKAERYKALLLVLNIITIFFYFLPVISAYLRSMWLENELSDVFPYKEQETQLKEPYSFLKMFSGIGIKDVSPTIFLYKKSPGKDLNLDFYSGGEKKLPCVIVIHGGSWSAGDSRQLPDLNSYLANRNYHVAAINYRLAPEFQSPAPVEDVRDALAFLSSKSDELHIDTSNFVLVGRSAGGQIALLTAYTSENKNIKGVVSFYAPADMV
ncbi:MAG: esterase/lipase, partial [Bacteroidetes bacterium]|nr:esterase/lipase [Bacteroidota bacterium]